MKRKALFAIFLILVLTASSVNLLAAEELMLKDVVIDNGMSILSPPMTVGGLINDENSLDDITSFYRSHSVYLDIDSGLIIITTYGPNDAVKFSFSGKKNGAGNSPAIDPDIFNNIVVSKAKEMAVVSAWSGPVILVNPGETEKIQAEKGDVL